MQLNQSSVQLPGVPLALGSAVLFGAATPLSKLLLASIDPQMLAGLLYFGAGLGLAAVHATRAAIGLSAPEAPPRRHDVPWLIAIVIFGGILGPALLMLGLGRTPASSGSLMLNLESLATMGIAWLIFRENVDRRLLLGALAIVLGAIALSWEGQGLSLDVGAVLIASACLCWGIDNNLTRKTVVCRSRNHCNGQGPVRWRGKHRRRILARQCLAVGRHRDPGCAFGVLRDWGQPCSFCARPPSSRRGSHRRLLLARPLYRRVDCLGLGRPIHSKACCRRAADGVRPLAAPHRTART